MKRVAAEQRLQLDYIRPISKYYRLMPDPTSVNVVKGEGILADSCSNQPSDRGATKVPKDQEGELPEWGNQNLIAWPPIH